MDDKAVKSWLDIAPAYLNFVLKFVRDPRRAFSSVAGTAQVSSDLTSILLGGVALSYLIVVLGGSRELEQDPGSIAGFVRGLDRQVLPLLGVLATFVLAVVSHLCGKLYATLSRVGSQKAPGKWDPKLGGGVEDSVNAALGFAAVYAPLTAAVICVSSRLGRFTAISAGVGGVLLAAFLLIYFPWALSATHRRTSVGQAFVALGGGLVLVGLVLASLGLW
jgi:hypothetical protein